MEKHKPDIIIMLVERDEVSLKLLELLFEKTGYRVKLMKFNSLTEAAACLTSSKSPDLLITDFFLNKIEDFRFLLLAKQLEISLKKSMRIVVLGDFEVDKHKIPEEIKAEFVLKPVDADIVKGWLV